MKKFLSLLLGACTIFTACTNDNDNLIVDGHAKLSVNVGLNQTGSRALITEATLPDGEEGAIGVMLTDGDATLTDYDAYTNVKFTGTTGSDGVQGWTGVTDILLTENTGTVYACFPYNANTDFTMSTIAIETTSQTDYLYATPVEGICETSSAADLTMNHALTNIKLTFTNAGYEGNNTVSDVSVSGQGIATAAVFNAAQTTPAYVAGSFTGVGDAITSDATTTLGGTAIDIMVISNDANEPITIAAKIGGVDYSVTTKAIALAKGNSYNYTLKVKSTYMAVSNVEVTPWNQLTMDEELNMEKDKVPTGPTINSADKENGVYAITATGELVDKELGNADCIGVALISNNHHIMIAKNDATDGTNDILCWGASYYDVFKLKGIGNYSEAGSDYMGKENTYKIIRDYAISGKEMYNGHMCKVLVDFNEGSDIDVYGNNYYFSDWYVPAAGQLKLIYKNLSAINEILVSIGGIGLDVDGEYWSSTESTTTGRAWGVGLSDGTVGEWSKENLLRVRFIRDIMVFPVEEVIGTIDLTTAANGVYAVAKNGKGIAVADANKSCIAVAFITDNQRVMIAKENAENATTNSFYWGANLYQKDISDLVNQADQDAAKADFSGKANTAAIIDGYTEYDVEMDPKDMCWILRMYNEGSEVETYGDNQGYSDWYIPALGQLWEINSTMQTDINSALVKMGGKKLEGGEYWSSSELDENYAWIRYFNYGTVKYTGKKVVESVRFVRDID